MVIAVTEIVHCLKVWFKETDRTPEIDTVHSKWTSKEEGTSTNVVGVHWREFVP